MFQTAATFTGSFDEDCQVKSVPQSLLTLVAMILDGPNIKSQSGDGVTQATLSTAQLLQYNSSIRRRIVCRVASGFLRGRARARPRPPRGLPEGCCGQAASVNSDLERDVVTHDDLLAIVVPLSACEDECEALVSPRWTRDFSHLSGRPDPTRPDPTRPDPSRFSGAYIFGIPLPIDKRFSPSDSPIQSLFVLTCFVSREGSTWRVARAV
ncbi:hypothetical protein GWK47_025922 [Chionoecetes opilio]|uniref:Uncharacterized protein n=1 Tax=Chionoecetes opilio TaxID=41210 RepID=A0A8J8WCW4_CHIOP|nr:hypothetical protein GWK47_025922 [Chionoecetes opilio]